MGHVDDLVERMGLPVIDAVEGGRWAQGFWGPFWNIRISNGTAGVKARYTETSRKQQPGRHVLEPARDVTCGCGTRQPLPTWFCQLCSLNDV